MCFTLVLILSTICDKRCDMCEHMGGYDVLCVYMFFVYVKLYVSLCKSTYAILAGCGELVYVVCMGWGVHM